MTNLKTKEFLNHFEKVCSIQDIETKYMLIDEKIKLTRKVGHIKKITVAFDSEFKTYHLKKIFTIFKKQDLSNIDHVGTNFPLGCCNISH